MDNEIFVFGSNQAGRHGKGAALEAVRKWGAIYGQGEGLQGRSYAIPTKDFNMHVRTHNRIAKSVQRFILFAKRNPGMVFRLTAVGCGLAGYAPEQIAPLFADAPSNVKMPPEFEAVLKPCESSRPSHLPF